MRGNRLHQYQPVVLGIVDNDVRHLAMGLDLDTELGQRFAVEVSELFARVANVQRHAARRKVLSKQRDDLLNQDVLPTRRKRDSLARWQFERDAPQLTLAGIALR